MTIKYCSWAANIGKMKNKRKTIQFQELAKKAQSAFLLLTNRTVSSVDTFAICNVRMDHFILGRRVGKLTLKKSCTAKVDKKIHAQQAKGEAAQAKDKNKFLPAFPPAPTTTQKKK